MLIWTLLILLGIAHETETGCAPFPHLERIALAGKLTHHMMECLEAEAPNAVVKENKAWVLWVGRWRGGQSAALRDKGARALLKTSVLPDRSLWAAGLLIEENPALAREALIQAESQALSWGRLSYRLDQLQELFRLRIKLDPQESVRWAQSWRGLGVVGPYLDEAVKACETVASAEICGEAIATPWLGLSEGEHWKACKNVTHLWTQRMGQRAYSTQRDCVIQAAALAKAGAGRDHLVRLALLLAHSRDEPHVTGAAMRLFAPLLQSQQKTIFLAAEFHRKHGDTAGAQWWENQEK